MENEVMDAIQENLPADQPDPFLTGWGDDEPRTAETPADQPEDAAGATPQTNTEAPDDGKPQTRDEPDPESEHPQDQEPTDQPPADDTPADTTWTVTYMGETRTMRPADITPDLIQKGLDYDRVKGQIEEYKPIMGVLNTFANKAGMSTADYVRFLRAEVKKADGLSDEEARRAMDLEDREAAVSAKEEAEAAQRQEREEQQKRARDDLAAFARAFPDVYEKAKSDKSVIPASVWDAVAKGLPLTAAYAQHVAAEAAREAQAAKDREEAAKANQASAAKSTGSMVSAGSDSQGKDPFLEGWDSV